MQNEAQVSAPDIGKTVKVNYVMRSWELLTGRKLTYTEVARRVADGTLPKPFKFSDRLARDGKSRQRNWWIKAEVDAAIAALLARAKRT